MINGHGPCDVAYQLVPSWDVHRGSVLMVGENRSQRRHALKESVYAHCSRIRRRRSSAPATW